MCTPPFLVLKCTEKNHKFFDFQPSHFSYWLLIVYMKLQQNFNWQNLSWMLLKDSQNYKKTKHVQKLRALHGVCLKSTKIFLFWFSLLFRFVTVAAPDRTDAPTYNKYFRTQPNSFRSTNIRILNIDCTPSYLVLKSTNGNHKFFRLSTIQFFLLNFKCKYEALTPKTYTEWFSWVFKIARKLTYKKIIDTPVGTNFQEICYSTVQSLSDALKSEFWILGAVYHVFSRKVLMKTIIFSTLSFLNFLVDFFTINMKLPKLKRMLQGF